MFLHLLIPGFHAAVHQTLEPALAGRPVAVAVDASPHAPLFAASTEAMTQGITIGMRADHAQRRAPGLAIRLPDSEAYRTTQKTLAGICNAFTPLVGGTAGRLDLDLAGTEALWRQQLRTGDDPLTTDQDLTRVIAEHLAQQCLSHAKMRVAIGGASRLFVARLLAGLAAEPHVVTGGMVIANPSEEDSAIDLMSVDRLACDQRCRDLLRSCGISSIAQLRALSADEIVAFLGPQGTDLFNAIHGLVEDVVPALVDPEPSLTTSCRAPAGGADERLAADMMAALARDLGFLLRQRHLGCTRLSLEGRWIDGRTTTQSVVLPYQQQHDENLAAYGRTLMAKASRRVHWERLRLTASGLCAKEDQQELFTPDRSHRLEAVQDAIRTRFGRDLVRSARPAFSIAG